MCGIVGYIGEKKAKPILINGLLRLEYRGYDSAGIATVENGTIINIKNKGRVSELENIETTTIDNISYILRGYDNIAEKLRQVGAKIEII